MTNDEIIEYAYFGPGQGHWLWLATVGFPLGFAVQILLIGKELICEGIRILRWRGAR